MSLLPLVYYAKSESGKQGYVMPLEIAELMSRRERPPDEHKGTTELIKSVGNTNGRPKFKVSQIGD